MGRRGWRGLCIAGCALGAGAMAALLVGRIASDRWAWSQPLFWIPGALFATAGLVGGALGLGAGRLGRWRAGQRAAGVAVGASVAAMAWVAVVEWRWTNALRPAPAPGAACILGWNATEAGADAFRREVIAQRPDILVAINPPAATRWADLAGDLWNVPPGETGRHVRVGSAVVIASRFPQSAGGATGLGLRGEVSGAAGGRIDPGQAVFATVEAGEAPLTIWAIDLPSDPELSRRQSAGRARGAIDESRRQVWTLSPGSAHFEPGEMRGFPAPDVILGDFNTTRRAASLAPLVSPLRDAHRAAGLGPDATWPRPRPLLGLDQAFVRRGLRIWRYDVLDPGAGSHRMQRLLVALPGAQ